MKTKLLKTYNASIAWLLATLGFMTVNSGCMKYGVESADYIVKGNVSSKETQQPIEGVDVCNYDCTQTNAIGTYEIWSGTPYVNLSFNDPAGNYESLDTLIQFQGKETNKTVNIQLTPKEK